jgi:glycosyltransferase involved in cell wall biosynthesis
MRESDVLLLPSLEEGFGLTCVEAMASGAVPLVSDACTDVCVHGENALVHEVADVAAITRHLTILDEDRDLLADLRAGCLRTAPSVTWTRAGEHLLDAYRTALEATDAAALVR